MFSARAPSSMRILSGNIIMLRPLAMAATLLFASGAGAEEPPALPNKVIDTAQDLMRQGLADRRAYDIVESLTTEVGPRLAGTEAEARARQWAVNTLESLGFDKVRVEPFKLPLWIRGVETADIITPYPQPLTITTLGGSASTGPDGVTGEVAAYPDLARLKSLPDGALKLSLIHI